MENKLIQVTASVVRTINNEIPATFYLTTTTTTSLVQQHTWNIEYIQFTHFEENKEIESTVPLLLLS